MSEKYTENLFTLDVRSILGVSFEAPYHSRLLNNFHKMNPRQNVDISYILFQHATTGYKLGSASYYLSKMSECSGFYTSSPDGKGVMDFELDFQMQAHFQLNMDNFLTASWGAIISTCRELWKAYGLKLDAEKVNFWNTKEQFKKDLKNLDITKFLERTNNEVWFKYLNGARNRVEHGQIIMIEYKGKTGKIVIADEQNVDKDKITTMLNYEPVPWCNTIFENTCRIVNYCCNDLNTLLYE